MARSIKIKGKNAILNDLQGKTFDKVEYVFNGGTHQIWFRSATGSDYCLWGESCCCDVARIDTIGGDLSNLNDHPIESAVKYGPLYTFYTEFESASVRWYSKHEGFLDKGVRLTEKVKK